MIPKHIQNIKAYVPPLFRKGKNRLFMNENLYGPSPRCLKVLESLKISDLYRYPYGGDVALKEKLAQDMNISSDNICLNNGSSEVIKQIFMILLEEKELVLLPKPGWSYYEDAVYLSKGTIKYYYLKEDEREFYFDINEITKQIFHMQPKVVVITSPNMPTGNKILQKDLIYLLEKFCNVYFLVDEAYWGFEQENLMDIKYLIERYKNVIFSRTFSKFYGLASERIGWLMTDKKLCKEMQKGAPLFGISYIAQLIAMTALDSKDYYDDMRRKINNGIREFIEQINEIENFYAYPSKANFVLIKVPEGHSKGIEKYLEENGYLVRECSKYGMNSFIRITIGTKEINQELVKKIKYYANFKR